MRILLAGATGVLGRATLPHLRTHDVVGLARSPERVRQLDRLGVDAVVCDVFDYAGLVRLTRQVRPQTVVNFVTDLRTGSMAANNRARRNGGRNLAAAADQAAAARLVVESVGFGLDHGAAEAVERLEQSTRDFPGEGVILRFGRLWGPGTSHDTAPQPPAIHIDRAGAEAARLLVDAPAGTYVVT